MSDGRFEWPSKQRYDVEFARRFSERKKRQLNNGQCAAIVADCDCDWCISNDIKRDLSHWKSEASS